MSKISRQLKAYHLKRERETGIPWDQQVHKVGRKPKYLIDPDRESRENQMQRIKEMRENNPEAYKIFKERQARRCREYRARVKARKAEQAAQHNMQPISDQK
jgi:hypothetical protein